MQTINIQKSKLAALVGAGWDNEKIAKHFGISIADVRKAKSTFGIGVRTKDAGYHVNLIDDMEDLNAALSEPEDAGSMQDNASN